MSTDEQAAEGFSIEGQAERQRAYAELHELGAVTVIADPGWSGKDLNRPGLQELLAAVEAGHVSHVLLWRLDRLSRNLGDLIVLADQFGQAGVALHSFAEKLDLSSATGRIFYNILGTSLSSTGSSSRRTSGWATSKPCGRAGGSTGPRPATP